MRILVTGGNGYVGREVTRLVYDRHEVCVADNVRYGRIRFSEPELTRLRFARVDITSPAAITELMAVFHPDAIVHLAAIHYIPECEADPVATLQTNVLGTMNLLRAAPAGCRFVYASSGAVYKPDLQPHAEATATVEPTDIYGISKLQGEQYVRHFAQTRGLAAIVVRLFNVIGPGETNPHLLPELVAQLKAGRKTICLGNTWPKRDYIHVNDAARGFVATALNREVASGEAITVNLGTSHQYSVEEIIGKLRMIADIDFALEHDQQRARAVDRPFLSADNTQIRKLFGWEPEHTIDDAIADLWRAPDLTEALMAKYQ